MEERRGGGTDDEILEEKERGKILNKGKWRSRRGGREHFNFPNWVAPERERERERERESSVAFQKTTAGVCAYTWRRRRRAGVSRTCTLCIASECSLVASLSPRRGGQSFLGGGGRGIRQTFLKAANQESPAGRGGGGSKLSRQRALLLLLLLL